jgi:hypothetical protein
MTLGKQFENTYWHDDQGQIQSSVRTPTFQKGLAPLITKDEATVKAANVGPLQGMLFSPYVGTGTAKDPSVSPEARRSAVDKAVGFDAGEESYAASVKRKYGRPIGPRAAQTHQQMVRDAFDETDFPISELENTNARVLVNPQSGRSFAEEYTKDIKLNWTPGKTKTTRITEQVPTKGTPIHNPKFWDFYDKKLYEPELADPDLLKSATHWTNPTTGHSYQGLGDTEHEDFSGMSPYDTIRSLREKGYFPNLFPGKTSATTKHVGDTVKIEYDWTSRDTVGWNTRTMHTRFNPGEGTEERVRVDKTRVPPSVEPATLIHELGHQRDPVLGTKQSYRHLMNAYADPVEEGLADAHADRYYRHEGMFDDITSDHKALSDQFSRSGYGVGYHSWNNKLGNAVYIASRLHSQMSPDSYKDIPDRDTLMSTLKTPTEQKSDFMPSEQEVYKELEKGQKRNPRNRASFGSVARRMASSRQRNVSNALFLGHMVENFPHVREHLEATGYGDVADAAHKEYLTRGKNAKPRVQNLQARDMYHAMRRQHPEWEAGDQPTLPGFEK